MVIYHIGTSTERSVEDDLRCSQMTDITDNPLIIIRNSNLERHTSLAVSLIRNSKVIEMQTVKSENLYQLQFHIPFDTVRLTDVIELKSFQKSYAISDFKYNNTGVWTGFGYKDGDCVLQYSSEELEKK